jgi:NAD(P)-dependent dehydrogenase (short-subunit alcohol dehydrogenase family)
MMSKTWLVTGGARGLGRHIAEAVLAAGDNLVAMARDPGRLSDLQDRYDDHICVATLDVTDALAARTAVQTATKAFGRLDVLVNNAGFGHVAPFEQATEEDFRAQIDTNFYGVVNLTRAALPVMRRQRSGHIINISSVGGRIGTPGLSAYQSAKWAVGGLTEVLAQEVAPLGIKIVSVEPGGMRTPPSKMTSLRRIASSRTRKVRSSLSVTAGVAWPSLRPAATQKSRHWYMFPRLRRMWERAAAA